MSNIPDSGWLDRQAAEGQARLVLEELARPLAKTPPYEAFVNVMAHIPAPRDLLDIGCGVGAYYELLHRYYPSVGYRGCDISPEMIRLAKETFEPEVRLGRSNHFFVDDAMDVCTGADVILASSLVEVCPNWRDVLRHLFSLDFRYLILSRVRIWSDVGRETRERTYETIYTTTSFEVTHNWPELTRLIWDAGGVIDHTQVYQVDPDSLLCSLLCATRVESMYLPWNTIMEEPDVRELTNRLLAR